MDRPGHTKHLQTWELSPSVTVCDSPGLVFPLAGALVSGVAVSARAVYEASGLFPIAQVRETYSAVRLLHASQDLVRLYNLQSSQELREEAEEDVSPLLFCMALAERRGYRIARGKGSLDPHRAGLEVLKDCVDGAILLAFDPPRQEPADVDGETAKAAIRPPSRAAPAPLASAQGEADQEAMEGPLREVLDELQEWADAQDCG